MVPCLIELKKIKNLEISYWIIKTLNGRYDGTGRLLYVLLWLETGYFMQ
jgi:hypothetical protein